MIITRSQACDELMNDIRGVLMCLPVNQIPGIFLGQVASSQWELLFAESADRVTTDYYVWCSMCFGYSRPVLLLLVLDS